MTPPAGIDGIDRACRTGREDGVVLLALPITASPMVVVVGSGVLGPGLTCESADAVLSCPTNDLSAGAQELSRHPPVPPV